MEGIVASDDPGLLDWFSYTPSQNVIPSDAGGEKSSVKVDIEIAKAAVPLQRNISQVSVISDGSLSRSHTETLTKTRSVSRTIMEGNKETTQEAKVVSVWGKKLATLFPYIRMLQLQVDVKRSVAFLSPSRLPLIEPDMCIPRNYLTALSQGLDTEAIVICLPQICVHSSGLKPVSAIQEIPIQSLEGSLVGRRYIL
ncbi:hypothetical protein KUTeg_000684 [Tegillarca granosa]|uniref:Uncharacterized protein n=1 Tax=Tegillarca granosa TaxID=220873 RepID=A0ABQ9G2K2_TEGGR|nr:hypothetical protein KUTeg_000684 [Tegillarca granosa]